LKYLALFGILTSLLGMQGSIELHTPTAEEYLAAVPAILQQMEDETGNTRNQDILALQQVIREEVSLRYGYLQDISFDTLYAIEPYLPRSIAYELVPETEWGWHNLALDRWLAENQIDLSNQSSWQIRGYTLQIHQVDFTGDGVNEFSVALNFQSEGWGTYAEYFVLQHDPSQPSGYSRLGDTQLWRSDACGTLACSGQIDLHPAQDLTGDGIPEWIVSRGSCSSGMCGVGLRIYGWHQGSFVELTAEDTLFARMGSGGGVPSSPYNGDWLFENQDNDPASEVSQIMHRVDNRGCEFSEEQVLDWKSLEGQFRTGEIEYTYADTPWCALRLAHDAMLKLDFEGAIQQYEYFLTYEPTPEIEEVWDYVRMRLALAYAEVGRIDEAEALIAGIQPSTIADEMIHAMAEAVQTTFLQDQNAKTLCVALNSSLEAFSYWALTPLMSRYGQTSDYNVPLTYGGGDFGPASSGCYISAHWKAEVESLDPQLPLREQLEADGWLVAQEWVTDLNGDGVDETLIIPEVLNLGVLKWSKGSAIEIDPVFNQPSPSLTSTTAIIPLPDVGKGIAQLNLYSDGRGNCHPDTNVYPGWMEVWWLDNEGLHQAASDGMCVSQSIEETFPTVGELHLLDGEGDVHIRYWDSSQLAFSWPQPTATLSVDAVANSASTCSNYLYDFCGSLESPEEALRLIDLALQAPLDDAGAYFEPAFRYYRALILEILERPQEALTEYRAISETAPESAWAQLAALHLE
jgi:tetratricopeptide (TPR) repeat protein